MQPISSCSERNKLMDSTVVIKRIFKRSTPTPTDHYQSSAIIIYSLRVYCHLLSETLFAPFLMEKHDYGGCWAGDAYGSAKLTMMNRDCLKCTDGQTVHFHCVP